MKTYKLKIHKILNDVFKLKSFRGKQLEIIESIISGKDTMVLMPTGGGKSLCYQIPALCLPGVAIIITPLIALMKDQVDSLKKLDIPAESINSMQNFEEQKNIYSRLNSGRLKLLFVAPERLKNKYFREILTNLEISLVAIDEAHCISEWGHDFRPDYVRIPKTLNLLNNPPVIALTATATPEVRYDIVKHLNLKEPKIFMSGFDRPNLYYSVEKCRYDTEKDKFLKLFVERFKGTGIIYASTRKKVDHTYNLLKHSGVSVGKYHAGLTDDERRDTQNLFMGGKIDVICATNAFGMGIDKKDIRFVIHYNFPRTIEALTQEAGRAGRDGDPSNAIVLFSPKDRYVQDFFIENMTPKREVIGIVYNKLLKLGRGKLEITYSDIARLIGNKNINDAKISASIKYLEEQDFLRRLDRNEKEATIVLPEIRNGFLEFLSNRESIRSKIILFLYRYPKRIIKSTIEDLAEEIGVKREYLVKELNFLNSYNVIQYEPPFKGRGIFLPDTPLQFSNFDSTKVDEKRRRETEKLEIVLKYAYTKKCRRKFILDYFEDISEEYCGNCDRCVSKNKIDEEINKNHKEIKREIENIKNKEDSADPETLIVRVISETKQRYGRGMIIDILSGSKKRAILNKRLNLIDGYGKLSHLKKSEIESKLKGLINRKIIRISGPRRYPVLKLNN